MQNMLLLEDTRQTGGTEEMGREDFLQEVMFEPSHVRRVHLFSREMEALLAQSSVWKLSADYLHHPPGGPRFCPLSQQSRLSNQPQTPTPLPVHPPMSSSAFVLPSAQGASRLHQPYPRASALWTERELFQPSQPLAKDLPRGQRRSPGLGQRDK